MTTVTMKKKNYVQKGLAMNSDLLDEYCDGEFGHTDWEMSWDHDGNLIIKFFAEPRPEYLAEMEEEKDDE